MTQETDIFESLLQEFISTYPGINKGDRSYFLQYLGNDS